MENLKLVFYQAIIDGKWLSISYQNKKKELTDYFIGINDIDAMKGIIYCDLYNPLMGPLGSLLKDDSKRTFIYLNQVKNAKILNNSFHKTPEPLLKRASEEQLLRRYLDVDELDNNILKYLSDCYRNDNEPFIKDTVMVDGIDRHELKKPYKLNDEQFKALLDQVFKKETTFQAERLYRHSDLVMNYFSIDTMGKQYVVAFRRLFLDFKEKTLILGNHTFINKTFLLSDDKRLSLSSYLSVPPEVFQSEYDAREREFISLIEENYHNGEKSDTRPSLFLLGDNQQKVVDITLDAIATQEKEGKLNQPLKCFFGRNMLRKRTANIRDIVVYDRKKVNIDQIRVVFNAVKNRVTYVQGPPGTGKTETIFNVLLSCYVNKQTVLLCSNNNHPVDDIVEKLLKRFYLKKEDKNLIFFPFIRLGSNAELESTITHLRKIYQYVEKNKDVKVTPSFLKEAFSKINQHYDKLKSLLEDYENSTEIKETIQRLENFKDYVSDSPTFLKTIDEQLSDQRLKLRLYKEPSDQEVNSLCPSAREDTDFISFLYYSSLAHFKNLLKEEYQDIIDIIFTEEIDVAVTELNKYLRNDDNLKKFLEVFPVVLTTNLSSGKLGSPIKHFTLTIMDESGQCNIATSLIPICRAENLLLVGDTNQLQPVTVIDPVLNEKFKKQYQVSDDYDYVQNSILSTMLKKDKNSEVILLRYHYRCGRKIAEFANQRFYDGKLKLMNKNFGNLSYINVENNNSIDRNSYYEEANAIVRYVKEQKLTDCGIVTPFNNQAALINALLKKNKIEGVQAGTVHTLQGSERTTIIMSAALSLRTAKRTMKWIDDNYELINVAVTRAKENFVFCGDKKAIDLLYKTKSSDIKVLSDYVFKNGNITVPKSDIVILTDFSNNSVNEREFFRTITPYFKRRGSKMRLIRNMAVQEAIKGIYPEDFLKIGRKEFDVVVQLSVGLLQRRYRTITVFEIDGGEHLGNALRRKADKEKMEICQKYGVKLIRIANSEVKDYELIIRLFECMMGKFPTIDNEQISLFEEFE